MHNYGLNMGSEECGQKYHIVMFWVVYGVRCGMMVYCVLYMYMYVHVHVAAKGSEHLVSFMMIGWLVMTLLTSSPHEDCQKVAYLPNAHVLNCYQGKVALNQEVVSPLSKLQTLSQLQTPKHYYKTPPPTHTVTLLHCTCVVALETS